MRVYEFARKHNLQSAAVLAVCVELDIDATTAHSGLSERDIQRLVDEFGLEGVGDADGGHTNDSPAAPESPDNPSEDSDDPPADNTDVADGWVHTGSCVGRMVKLNRTLSNLGGRSFVRNTQMLCIEHCVGEGGQVLLRACDGAMLTTLAEHCTPV